MRRRRPVLLVVLATAAPVAALAVVLGFMALDTHLAYTQVLIPTRHDGVDYLRLRPSVGDGEINADGLRGRPYPRERTPGVPRVAVVGDSFVYGTSIRDPVQTMPAQVEDLLATRIKRPVEAMNFGVPGLKLDAYAPWLRTKVGAYRPDWVVFAFAPWTFQNPNFTRVTSDRLGLFLYPLGNFVDTLLPDRRTRSAYRSELETYLRADGTIRERLRAVLARCRTVNARCAGVLWPVPLKRRANLFAAVEDVAVDLLAGVGFEVIRVDDGRFGSHRPEDLMLSRLDCHPTPLAARLVAEAVTDFLVPRIAPGGPVARPGSSEP